MSIKFESLEVTSVVTNDASIVILSMGGKAFAEGTAKRRKGDRPNASIGRALAYARALESLAEMVRESLPEDIRTN